jgi:hypothetical protein
VDPPPALAATNRKPPGASITAKLGPKGSVTQTLQTPDRQLLFVMDKHLFPPHPGAREVLVRAKPMDPAKFPPLTGGLRAIGNAYLISASYKPGGDTVRRIASLPRRS